MESLDRATEVPLSTESPAKPTPQNLLEICAFVWKNQALNTASPGQPKLDVSDQDLVAVLTSLYPGLSFMELAQKTEVWSANLTLAQHIPWDDLFRHYGYPYNNRLKDLVNLLNDSPLGFCQWAQARKLSPKDLGPLLALKTLDGFEPVLEKLAQLNATRSEGRDLLDKMVDLHLLKNELHLDCPNLESWTSAVYKERFPKASAKDASQAWEMGWPKYAKYQAQRDGDRLYHRLTLQIENLDDGIQKLAALQQKLEERRDEI